MYDCNKHILNLMEGNSTRTFKLDRVISVESLEKYLEQTIINVTQSRHWYGKYSIDDPGLLMSFNMKMLGVVRIRQLRSIPGSCKVPEIMKFLNRNCQSKHVFAEKEVEFGIKWSTDSTSSQKGDSRMKYVWNFEIADETGSCPYQGELDSYPGGGYIAYYGRTMKNSYANLEYLIQHSWFDHLTRVVFIEMLLYNSNLNVFTTVNIVIERGLSGYFKNTIEVQTSKILLMENGKITALNILLYLLIFLVIGFAIRTFAKILKTGIWFYKDFEHLIDLALITLTITFLVVFFKRSKEIQSTIDSFISQDPKEFVPYFYLLKIENTFILVSSITIAVATLKIWSLFRLTSMAIIFKRTILKSFFLIITLIFYHVIVISAFSLSGYILLVDKSYRYQSFLSVFSYLVRFSVRSFNKKESSFMNESESLITYGFYVTYILSTFLFLGLYIGLIIYYLHKSKEDLSNLPEVLTVSKYMKDQIQFSYNVLITRFKRFRLSGGGDGDDDKFSPLDQKLDAHRYSDVYTLSVDKTRAMALITLCLIRNKGTEDKNLSEKDIKIMTYVLYYLKKMETDNKNSDTERYYRYDLSKNGVKFLPENRLLKMVAAVALITGETRREVMIRLKLPEDVILIEENNLQFIRIKENMEIMVKTVEKIRLRLDY